MSYPLIFSKYINVPLLATTELVNSATSLLLSSKNPNALSHKEGRHHQSLTEIRGNIGIINVTGPIFRYGEIDACSTVYGTQHFSEQLKVFEDDSAIDEIVFVFNTGGGEATGIGELAQQIRNCSKPTTAYVDGMAASGGYWLASACDKIVVHETATVGSLSGTDKWTEEGSSPMKTFREIRKERTDAGGKAPDTIVMGTELYQTYISHPETQKMYETRRIDRGTLKPELVEDSVIYVGYIPEIATHIYVYDETYSDDEGNSQYFVNPKGFIYATPKGQGVVAYGAIKDLQALYATKIFIKSWEEEDPSINWMLFQSAPVTIPTYKDAFAYCEAI